MRNRLLSIMLACILISTEFIGFSATKTAAQTNAEKRAEIAKPLGETVSTDLFDLTVDSADFCFYADNVHGSSFMTPLEKDNGSTPYKSNIGRTLVSLTFKITNKDRGDRTIGGTSYGYPLKWSLIYNDTSYRLNSFDGNLDGNSWFGLQPISTAISVDGGKTYNTSLDGIYTLGGGETVYIRKIGLVTMEPDSLNDGFELTVNVPNLADKNEYFIYAIE